MKKKVCAIQLGKPSAAIFTFDDVPSASDDQSQDISIQKLIDKMLSGQLSPNWSSLVMVLLDTAVSRHNLMSVRGDVFHYNKTGHILERGVRFLMNEQGLGAVPILRLRDISVYVHDTLEGQRRIAIINNYSHFCLLIVDGSNEKPHYAIINSICEDAEPYAVDGAVMHFTDSERQSRHYPCCATFAIEDCKEVLENPDLALDSFFSSAEQTKRRRTDGSYHFYSAYMSALQSHSMFNHTFLEPLRSPSPHFKSPKKEDVLIPGKILSRHLNNIKLLCAYADELDAD